MPESVTVGELAQRLRVSIRQVKRAMNDLGIPLRSSASNLDTRSVDRIRTHIQGSPQEGRASVLAHPRRAALDVVHDAGLRATLLDDARVAALVTTDLGDVSALRGLGEVITRTALRATPELARRGKFLVEFSPAVTEQLESGALSFLTRVDGRLQASAVDATKRIRGNATLAKDVARGAAKLALAAEVAILLVVQHQLVTIEAALARVERKLDELLAQNRDGHVERLRVHLSELHRIRRELEEAPRDEANVASWRRRLETSRKELDELQGTMRRERARRSKELTEVNVQVGFGFGPEKIVESLSSHADAVGLALDLETAALAGRVVTARLEHALQVPLAATGGFERELLALERDSEEHARVVTEKVTSFSSVWGSAERLRTKRLALLETTWSLEDALAARVATLREQCSPQDHASLSVVVETGSEGTIDRAAIVQRKGIAQAFNDELSAARRTRDRERVRSRVR